ncbi:MAG: hypothetical protein IPO08_21755 [Xanthomonadales bacterium]|nr:hypothetical protein [Xanthomonadales bacterium]
MRRFALFAVLALVVAGTAAAASKTWTYNAAAGWASPGWQSVTLAPAADADPATAGDQAGMCATINACGRASDGTLADCQASTRCAVTPPATISAFVDLMLGFWRADHGY